MKKLHALLITSFILSLTARAQQQKQFDLEYGQPLLVLTETNPWLMVAGADVPTFALYENGQIIYKQAHKSGSRYNGSRYYQTRFAQEQLQEFIGSLLIKQELLELPEKTAASRVADQPTNQLIFNFDTLVVKSTYGDLRHDSTARANTPPAFLKVYDRIIEFQDNHAKEWLPEKIEVLVSDYQHSTEQAVKWPHSWPTLKSPDTVWRSEKLYSLYLDKKHFKELLSLMKKLKDKQAVEINGKKFSISYRLPFPNML